MLRALRTRFDSLRQSLKNITERKRAEAALRDAEEFKNRLIASSEDCIKALDLEGRLLGMNEGGMRALEICDLGPVVNHSWIDFWEGEDREGGTGRFTKQARWWDVLISPIQDAEGKPERLLAVSRDVFVAVEDSRAPSCTCSEPNPSWP